MVNIHQSRWKFSSFWEPRKLIPFHHIWLKNSFYFQIHYNKFSQLMLLKSTVHIIMTHTTHDYTQGCTKGERKPPERHVQQVWLARTEEYHGSPPIHLQWATIKTCQTKRSNNDESNHRKSITYERKTVVLWRVIAHPCHKCRFFVHSPRGMNRPEALELDRPHNLNSDFQAFYTGINSICQNSSSST